MGICLRRCDFMDYLSGKQVNQSKNILIEDSKKKNIKFAFDDFCKYSFLKMSFEEKKLFAKKFLTSNVLIILEDRELMLSVKSFFDNDLNISLTSKNAFLHRNTLLYRIRKIEKITGLDIRKFSDAVSLKFLMMLNSDYKYMKR